MLDFKMNRPYSCSKPRCDGFSIFFKLGKLPIFGQVYSRLIETYHSLGYRFILKNGGYMLLLTLAASCTDPIKETRQVFTQDDLAVEVGNDVEILYSDSAIVRVRVLGPVLHNYSGREKENPILRIYQLSKMEIFSCLYNKRTRQEVREMRRNKRRNPRTSFDI